MLGICNGFQVLAEAGLLPGALLRNRSLRFAGREVAIAAQRSDTPFTRGVPVGVPMRMPVAHGEGCYYADEATLDELEARGQVLFRYVDADGRPALDPDDPANPNGSLRAIAGVTNRAGNVAGLMPHPERASESILGSADGLPLLAVAGGQRRRTRGRRRAGRGRPDAPRDRRRMTMVATPETPMAVPLHRQLGVTDVELDAIRERLGRDPNDLELAMFSVMWSEHCSYKSSKPLLATLPTRGSGVVAGPGENAGVVSIGDGLAVAFKIESHNHPSAVEPYQGAATGVGGILRDIFSMGARPIAVLDGLRFGDPADPRTRHLVDGVVRGVGGYGNCVGVPTVGGELVFDPSYQANPLVNVMAIGLLEERHLTLAAAPGPGNLAVLFGSTTGRDGIGGASVLASATFGAADSSKRPSVQVGDPFAEKLLIEASLELIERGLVVGLQDLGAGGITCATSETADRAGTGILVDLDAIPRREPGMAPFEVMISESQERMLAIVSPPDYDAVRAVCDRWGLPCAIIGRVTDDGAVTIVEGGLDGDGRPATGARELARIPASALTSDAIVYARVAQHPARRRPAPAPGCQVGRPGRPAGAGDGSGGRAARPAGEPEPVQPALGLRAVRQHRPDEHRVRPHARRGGRTADQGHSARPCRGACRQPGGLRDRPVARSRVQHRRGDAGGRRDRRPAARRHELPQLRRPHPPRGVLAAPRGGARARRRVSGAGPAGHRRQRLAVQRVAGRGHRADARDRRRRSARRRVRGGWSGIPAGRRRRRAGRRRRRRVSAEASTPALPGTRARTKRRASTSRARRPSSSSSWKRPRAGSWNRPGASRPAASPSPLPSARCGATSGRGCGWPSAGLRPWSCSARARRGRF